MSRSIDTLVNRFPFFRQAPSTILNKLSTFGIVRTFEPDTRIFWKGDSCTHIAFVFNQFSQKLVMVLELLEDVVFGKLDRRLMDHLIEKNENNKIYTTHKTIAQDLGSSREVITRLLKDMERNGRIKTGRGSIEPLGQ